MNKLDLSEIDEKEGYVGSVPLEAADADDSEWLLFDPEQIAELLERHQDGPVELAVTVKEPKNDDSPGPCPFLVVRDYNHPEDVSVLLGHLPADPAKQNRYEPAVSDSDAKPERGVDN